MPHQCTNCGYVFDDGSKEMLTGCPGCGGNKFQYHPGEVPEQPTQEEPPDRPGDRGVTGTVGKAAAKVRNLVGDDEPDRAPASTADTQSPSGDRPAPATGASSGSDDAPAETMPADAASGTNPESTASASASSTTDEASTDEAPTDESTTDSEEVPERDEDIAQQSARSEMVSENDLPPSSERPPSSDRGRVVSEPDSDERPDMEALREELNSQFESIRIVSPGKYELNLMELYDREEYIIALQENGRYVIEVPDAWEVENADETE